MATVAHLMFGPPGCGKTTFARKLEREGRCFRLSHDEWMRILYGANSPAEQFSERYDRVLGLIWDVALQALRCGCDVVLDCGFWTRASRDDARARLATVGAEAKLYAFACEVDEMRRRVLSRTENLPPDALYIDGPMFDVLAGRVEPLQLDEQYITVQSV